jgi:predicted kinase
MELVIFIGLQASGKTTFYCNNFAATHQHISKDLFPNNKNKDRRQTQLIITALSEGKSVVVDNTNPTTLERQPLIEIGNSHNCKIIGYYFNLPLNLCLERNSQRLGKAKVPEVGIYTTIKKLTRPSYDEGFHYLFEVDPESLLA